MAKPNHRSQHAFDEQLAAFSDQIQNGMDPNTISLAEDNELKQLQATVQFLHRQTADDPETALIERLKPRVAEVWAHEYGSKAKKADKKGADRRSAKPAYQSTARRQQLAAIRITAFAAVVIILAIILLPDLDISGGSASGAAIGSINPLVTAGIILLLGGVGVWWWLSSRRK